MNITRNNYESFFLLYVDNELSAAERKAVDAFVDANPDLLEELLSLQFTLLKPDTIVFDDKASLLKNVESTDSIQNDLLLYLDNELDAEKAATLKAAIATEKPLATEWAILQQTRLEADRNIVFPDKQVLYRRERRRVIAMPLFRISAASAVIAFLVWGGISYMNNKQASLNNTEVAVKENRNKPSGKVAPVKEVAPSSNKKQNTTGDSSTEVTGEEQNSNDQFAQQSNNNNNTGNKNNSVIVKDKSSSVKPLTKKVTDETIQEDDQLADVKPKSNNLPKPYNNINNQSSNDQVVTNVKPLKQDKEDLTTAFHANNDKENQANQFAMNAGFTNNDQQSGNGIFTLNEETVKKSKLGGFLRKVKRVVSRNTNAKEGDNNIRVANLEFAIQ